MVVHPMFLRDSLGKQSGFVTLDVPIIVCIYIINPSFCHTFALLAMISFPKSQVDSMRRSICPLPYAIELHEENSLPLHTSLGDPPDLFSVESVTKLTVCNPKRPGVLPLFDLSERRRASSMVMCSSTISFWLSCSSEPEMTSSR